MRKLNNSNKIILRIILNVLVASTLSVILLNLLFSFFIYKFDLSLDFSKYISYIICVITSFIVPMVSLSSLKNNGFIIGAMCSLPMIILSLINVIICHNSIIDFFIKVVLMIAICGVSGVLKTKKNRKFKVR